MDLGARLRTHLGADAFAAALAMYPEARRHAGAAGDALAVAVDLRREMAERCAALALASLLLHGGEYPDLHAVFDDDLLIDGAVAHGAVAALTALALGAGIPATELRYLAVRLAGSGATGANVAAVHVRVGDAVRAAHAFSPVLVDAGRIGSERTILALAAQLLRSSEIAPALPALLAALLERRIAHVYAAAARSLGADEAHALVVALSSR